MTTGIVQITTGQEDPGAPVGEAYFWMGCAQTLEFHVSGVPTSVTWNVGDSQTCDFANSGNYAAGSSSATGSSVVVRARFKNVANLPTTITVVHSSTTYTLVVNPRYTPMDITLDGGLMWGEYVAPEGTNTTHPLFPTEETNIKLRDDVIYSDPANSLTWTSNFNDIAFYDASNNINNTPYTPPYVSGPASRNMDIGIMTDSAGARTVAINSPITGLYGELTIQCGKLPLIYETENKSIDGPDPLGTSMNNIAHGEKFKVILERYKMKDSSNLGDFYLQTGVHSQLVCHYTDNTYNDLPNIFEVTNAQIYYDSTPGAETQTVHCRTSDRVITGKNIQPFVNDGNSRITFRNNGVEVQIRNRINNDFLQINRLYMVIADGGWSSNNRITSGNKTRLMVDSKFTDTTGNVFALDFVKLSDITTPTSASGGTFSHTSDRVSYILTDLEGHDPTFAGPIASANTQAISYAQHPDLNGFFAGAVVQCVMKCTSRSGNGNELNYVFFDSGRGGSHAQRNIYTKPISMKVTGYHGHPYWYTLFGCISGQPVTATYETGPGPFSGAAGLDYSVQQGGQGFGNEVGASVSGDPIHTNFDANSGFGTWTMESGITGGRFWNSSFVQNTPGEPERIDNPATGIYLTTVPGNNTNTVTTPANGVNSIKFWHSSAYSGGDYFAIFTDSLTGGQARVLFKALAIPMYISVSDALANDALGNVDYFSSAPLTNLTHGYDPGITYVSGQEVEVFLPAHYVSSDISHDLGTYTKEASSQNANGTVIDTDGEVVSGVLSIKFIPLVGPSTFRYASGDSGLGEIVFSTVSPLDLIIPTGAAAFINSTFAPSTSQFVGQTHTGGTWSVLNGNGYSTTETGIWSPSTNTFITSTEGSAVDGTVSMALNTSTKNTSVTNAQIIIQYVSDIGAIGTGTVEVDEGYAIIPTSSIPITAPTSVGSHTMLFSYFLRPNINTGIDTDATYSATFEVTGQSGNPTNIPLSTTTGTPASANSDLVVYNGSGNSQFTAPISIPFGTSNSTITNVINYKHIIINGDSYNPAGPFILRDINGIVPFTINNPTMTDTTLTSVKENYTSVSYDISSNVDFDYSGPNLVEFDRLEFGTVIYTGSGSAPSSTWDTYISTSNNYISGDIGGIQGLHPGSYSIPLTVYVNYYDNPSGTGTPTEKSATASMNWIIIVDTPMSISDNFGAYNSGSDVQVNVLANDVDTELIISVITDDGNIPAPAVDNVSPFLVTLPVSTQGIGVYNFLYQLEDGGPEGTDSILSSPTTATYAVQLAPNESGIYESNTLGLSSKPIYANTAVGNLFFRNTKYSTESSVSTIIHNMTAAQKSKLEPVLQKYINDFIKHGFWSFDENDKKRPRQTIIN